MEKTRVTVNIAGQEFKLKVNETAEYMESLSRYINSQIAEVQSQYPALSVNNSILLAMLSMADEYHKLIQICKARRRKQKSRKCQATSKP